MLKQTHPIALIDTAELARRHRVVPQTVRERVRAGKLPEPHIRHRRGWYWLADTPGLEPEEGRQ